MSFVKTSNPLLIVEAFSVLYQTAFLIYRLFVKILGSIMTWMFKMASGDDFLNDRKSQLFSVNSNPK